MKTVFKSDEIAHVWAHKSAPYGKSPGAVSFDGPVIRSYQTAMARHIEHQGKSALILNVTSYSVTTSKHQGWINRAIHGLDIPVFRVDGQDYDVDLRFTGEELFTHYVEQAAQSEKDSRAPRIRPHTREAHKGRVAHYLEQAKLVSEFFGLGRKVDEKAIERNAAAKLRAEKRERIAREKAEAEECAHQKESFEAWKQGAEWKELRGYFNPRLFPVAFRIEGEELVSTLGARVPLDAARVALRFVLAKRATGWHRNGETQQVGMYQLDAVNAQGVVAGCHRISWEEIERVAGMLQPVTA